MNGLLDLAKILICCRTNPDEQLLFHKIFSKKYRAPGSWPWTSKNCQKAPSLNFASSLWKIGTLNLCKKCSVYVKDYSEQLWFYKIFSKEHILGGDSFLARTVKTRQISKAKNMFFWVSEAFRRFLWLDHPIQKCWKYFFTVKNVIGFHACRKCQSHPIVS